MKINFIFLLSFLLLNCAKPGVEARLPDKYYPERNPKQDLQLAIQIATQSKKRILLKVGGEWCIWCHRLDDFIEENKDLKTALKENYVVLKINFSPENKNEDFLGKYPKIAGYPHIFVLDSNGDLLHSQNTGDLEFEKSYNVEKLMAFLEEWKPKS